MYFLRVIIKDTVAVSFNNMLFLGFVRQEEQHETLLFKTPYSLITDTLLSNCIIVKEMPQTTC